MAIRFTCPKCSTSISTPDSMCNREIPCPSCNIKLKVALKPSSSQSIGTVKSSRAPLPSEMLRSGDFSPSENARHGACSDAPSESLGLQGEDHTKISEKSTSSKRKRIDTHHEEEDVEWDITPMVDVAFLLLIFFMLTAAFSIQKAIPSSAAPSEEASKAASVKQTVDLARNLIIQIDEFNGFTVLDMDGQSNLASSKQELVSILLDLKEEYGTENVRVLIQAHVESLHGAAVTCMDASRQAGFGTFQLRSVEQF